MTWVNLNDVYVKNTGGTINGDLDVNGAITVNDGSGNGTKYNVANEISTLRDSVSRTQIETGSAIVNVTQSNVTTRTRVQFKKPFSSAPSVSVAAQSGYPEQISLSVDDITTSGFTIAFRRSSATSTGVTWIAVAV